MYICVYKCSCCWATTNLVLFQLFFSLVFPLFSSLAGQPIWQTVTSDNVVSVNFDEPRATAFSTDFPCSFFLNSQVLYRTLRTSLAWHTFVSTCCSWERRSTPRRMSTASSSASTQAVPMPLPVESIPTITLTCPMSTCKEHLIGTFLFIKWD